ncbi:MAG: PqiC family protein [Gammaproteobacteria bacterium]|nr:PqiC family protein [Gammaproteobacteria bacterium]
MTCKPNRIIPCLYLLLCLTACGSSPPSNFYRLTAAVAPATGGQQPSLGIGPVDIPEFLNRNALVYTRGGNQLQLADTDRWAEPLEYGVKRVVGLNLSQLLHTENLQFFPWDLRQAPEYGVRINILDLDARDGQATLVVDWLLYRAGDGTSLTHRISQFTQPLASEQPMPGALPAAYSALLYQLSETIAEAIRAEQQGRPGETGEQ